ncbi:hypothetical protein AB3662_27335 [Sorangium cellulosum]|uniref:hypothetical protein n=1 Tax=Sorangium cellulosum TaxID=56 RepID=UPI003D9AB2AB
MSLVVARSSLLSSVPRVWVDGDHLHARTSFGVRALSLFSYAMTLHVDRRARYVFIERRTLWFLRRSRAIPFGQIEHIDYRFSSVTTEWGLGGRPTDQVESFSVDLVLRGEEEPVRLFRFRGEGSVSTGHLGVLLGDTIVDLEGGQEDASRRFVALLQEFIGVGLGKPMPRLRDGSGRAWACLSCMRPAPPRPGRCLYCGGQAGPSEGPASG